MSLPKDWKIQTLAEVLELVVDRRGLTPLKLGGDFASSGVSIISAIHIKDNRLNLEENKRFVSQEMYDRWMPEKLKIGDVLLTSEAPLGALALLDKEAEYCLSQRLFALRSSDGIMCGPFLYYALLSDQLQERLLKRASGSTAQGIRQTELLKVIIEVPPLPEQIEIARILGVWDAAIDDTTQLIAAKIQHKRGLMQQLLTGERRFAEFKGLPFVSRAIGDVLALRSRLVKWDDEATYRLASVRRNSGGLFWREALHGDQIKVKKLHTVHTGDFLISHIQAAYGAMGCVSDSFDGGHVSDMYSILTPLEGAELDIRLVDYLSQMPIMHRHILQSSNGFFAERLRLNFDPLEFLKQTLDLPPTLAEQRRIADTLDAATTEIDLLQQQLDALKTQKRGLMQLLLSGEKRLALTDAGNLGGVARSNTGGQS